MECLTTNQRCTLQGPPLIHPLSLITFSSLFLFSSRFIFGFSLSTTSPLFCHSFLQDCIFGSTYLAIHPEQVPSTQSLHHDAPTTMLQSRGWCFQGTGFLPNVALCPKVKVVQILSLLHGISSVFFLFLLINLLQSPIRAPSELLI